MSTSGSDSDDSSTSENSDVSQIYDYEQEIEEDSPSDNTHGENSAVMPYARRAYCRQSMGSKL